MKKTRNQLFLAALFGALLLFQPIESKAIPADANIKETVIVLNLLGFPTTQSCEGYLRDGTAHPWVGFEITQPELLELGNEIHHVYDYLIQKPLKSLKRRNPDKSYEEILELPEAEEINNAIVHYKRLLAMYEKEATVVFQPLLNMISDFYQLHMYTKDTKLTLRMDGIVRLQNQGVLNQKERGRRERRSFLHKYQREFEYFTKFLKALYSQRLPIKENDS